ncbi:MAG: hypothetical protein IKM33_05195 [Clostridia bacterium]|nr:hypothetical protein [Clostridia bacterium]
MYSKEKGFTHAPVGTGGIHRPNRAPRVSIPPNYRGHAIVDGEERPLGVVKETPSAASDTPVPHFDGLPRISQLGEGRRYSQPRYEVVPDDRVSSFSDDEDTLYAKRVDSDGSVSPEEEHAAGTDTRLSPPPRPVPFRNAFGGGLSLGTEELLLLGLILLLLREGGDCADRGDLDETVILLGLLLLLG